MRSVSLRAKSLSEYERIVGPEPVADEGCETLYGYELRPLLRVVR